MAVAAWPGGLEAVAELGLDDLEEEARRMPARAVATDERRRIARRAVHELCRAAVGQSLFHEQLDSALAVEAPSDPGDDELWVATVMGGPELC